MFCHVFTKVAGMCCICLVSQRALVSSPEQLLLLLSNPLQCPGIEKYPELDQLDVMVWTKRL